ncbi:MAG TPA: phosphotransferase [Ktedonobacteraceae bacterium]|nr:phosphotransferase [Ktedonobacteraceae bacterium]
MGKGKRMSHPYFPVSHSILSANALLTYAQERYDIGDAIECQLLNLGLNDTYFLQTSTGKYILRVYRKDWRTFSDILYELDMLLHLHRKRVPISYPLVMKDGNLFSTLNTLEGPRQVVLFPFAEGELPRWPRDETYSLAYGQGVAFVHNALDDFTTPHTRFRLDLDHLLERPLRTILPLLEDRPEDRAYLLHIVDVIKKQIADLPLGELEWGACHGDFHGGNAHITGDLQVVFFDFDCCGPGWRAYDIAVFRWARALNQQDETLWEAFLRGYRQQRTIQAVDLAAVPLFVAIRQIWLLGLHTSNAPDWGYGFLNKHYFDSNMQFLKGWIDEHIQEA